MSMTAREYFFRNLAPEHAEQSYQAAYRFDVDELLQRSQSSLPPEEFRQAIAKAVRHVPCYSNDILIERAMEKLICRVPVDLRARLEKMFVAKLRNDEANAAAHCSAGDYDGDLIFFNVGLSNVCSEYAIIYYECVAVIVNHIRPDLVQHTKGLEGVVEHISKLKTAQDRWDRLGYIGLTPDDLLFSTPEIEAVAANISECVNRFILRHEISHHILGHTQVGARLLSYVEDLPEHCKYWRTAELASHQMEYEADASALTMTLQQRDLDVETERQREFEVIIGGLLTLTVVGQLVHDVDDVTSSHPSVSSRFDQCVDILRSTCKYEFGAYLYLMKRFQQLLWHTQGKGLGRRWGDEVQLD